ncbi:uncharacterized protein LOC135666459 [Musa acuminata AAA Group]|uniref:(wild Malaysian banana) hypothetical protein n=1 Tax=Musa acuminata subsp. malaccensis TaxID=214687 RepID=A0A804JCH1_MUSAM|nr:PREDICTED: uncharacterized protein LOC103986780 [Musa acuminata subsp. malaccensis]CAG1845244.1 unnamed protein product [Musa acuminata subsp. malaccensis]
MATAYYHHNGPHCDSPYSPSPPLPLHLCLFLLTLFIFVGLSWYMAYESVFESLLDQLKLLLMASPLLLLLVVHWLSNDERRRVPFFIPLPERESFHRAGGSPWGVGLLVVLLMFMISYQSYFHERWFPLLSR